ncbi:hypothetical protein EDB87DRAFT_1628025 [Lactarius vividus]|nr:hypothetical protein EDB87DRAFT_1628025 [Lactarius vividus]
MTKQSKPSLPDMHYLTEPERAQVHPAVVRTISIPSIPPDFPFNTPISDERRHRGPRFIIGWLEFQSPEQPDPEVARPGDVWIQLPSGHRKARVYACYNPEGKDWLPWAGNHIPTGGRGDTGNTPIHPFLNDHAQRKFFLVFNGTQFTWANPKGVSIILHTSPQIGTIGPAEAVIKWLKVTGVGRSSPTDDEEEEGHSTSAPLNSRKHAHPDHSPGDSASAPPEKKAKRGSSQWHQSSPDLPLAVKLGAYAQAGATQQGWIMYIDGMPLHMPFPCINCTRSKAPCSGIPGERCGRCRFKRLGCSHHAQKPRERTASPAKEAKEAPKAAAPDSSPTTQTGLTLRLPAMRPWVAVNPGDTTRAEDATKAPGQSSPRRVRIRSSSVGASNCASLARKLTHLGALAARSDNENVRSSSPLSSVHDHSDPVPHHSESAILDATDDAAVENLLDSALVSASAVPVPDADVEAEAEGDPRSSVTAAEIGVPEKTLSQDEADGSDEDEEFARFMQMTLDGMARAQEGLRAVFALTRRRLVVKRAAAAAAVAPQVAAVVEGAAAVAASVDACAPGGDGPVSAPH